MRYGHRFWIGAALALGIAAPAQAQRREAEGIDGWGPFRFHMTLDAARAAGAAVGQVASQWDDDAGQVLNLTASLDGAATLVRVVFRGWHEPIKHIAIRPISERTDDRDGCLARLEGLAAKVRRNYRDFEEYPAERASGDGVSLRTIDLRFRDGSWIQVEVHYNANQDERDGRMCEGNVFYFPSHAQTALDF